MPHSYPVDCQPVCSSGIHHQRTEVGVGSDSDLHLSRRRLRFGGRCCATYHGEGRQAPCSVLHPEETPPSRGQVCVEGVGLYERHRRHHPLGEITHAPAAALSDKPVVDVHTTSFSPPLLELGVPGSSSVVDRRLQPSPGQTTSLAERNRDPLHRQLSQGMGGIPECDSPGPREMGPGDSRYQKHQLDGTEGDPSELSTFPALIDREVRDGANRQHVCPVQPGKGRRDTLSPVVLHRLGYFDPVPFEPDPPTDSAPDRRGECGRGQTQSCSQSDPDRMDLTRRSVSSSSPRAGGAGSGLVCNMPEPQASRVREPLSGSQSSSPGCVESRLEYSPVGVRFPSDADHAQGTPEDESFYLSDDPDRPSLAGSVLVSGSPVPVGGSAPGVADIPGASLSGRRTPDVVSPEPRDVQLPRLDVVRSALSQRGFSERAAKHIAVPQRSSTRLVYEGKWAEFCAWCDRRKADPVQASVPLVADFLTELFERIPPLAVSTIHGYRSALSSTVPHGPSLTNSQELGALMRSFAKDRPVTRVFYPRWSLRIVLNYLMKPPFEPIAKCSLENLTLKTVFLVALASGRRRSELCALSFDPQCFRFSPNLAQVQLLTEPGFLAKTQKPSKMPAKIVIKSLVQFVGHDLPDYTLCPVRALKAYKDKTKDAAIRRGRRKLFIPFRPLTDDIKPVHVSNWIVSLIKRAHRDSSDDDCRLANVTAHEVRSIATSWAIYNNAPFEEIMQAADWSGQSTFTNFYSRAMTAHAEGLYDLGPIVAAQSVVAPPATPN